MSDLKLFLKDFKWQSFWIITSSLFINILALSSSLYVIQIFNRYLSYKIDSTLIILTLEPLGIIPMDVALRVPIQLFLIHVSPVAGGLSCL